MKYIKLERCNGAYIFEALFYAAEPFSFNGDIKPF